MPGSIEVPTATLVTAANATLLAVISGMSMYTMRANIGWVLFRDVNLKYYLIPRSEYEASHHNVPLKLTLVDN